ncbi:MAG: aminotransferase class IV [Cyclobacteriaceae bacterium]|nr:aminotransferase class IV [Cyclobacteriaceae bacterium]
MENSSKEIFSSPNKWTFENILRAFAFPQSGLFKVRVVYDEQVKQVEFVPYQPKPVKSLKLIFSDSICYSHKFENRKALNELFVQRGNCDDIIIVKNGFVTDASYANLIFRKDNNWYAPTTFLLNGTMRAFLINTGRVTVTEIRVEDLVRYEACKLVNSMLGMEAPEILISSIE